MGTRVATPLTLSLSPLRGARGGIVRRQCAAPRTARGTASSEMNHSLTPLREAMERIVTVGESTGEIEIARIQTVDRYAVDLHEQMIGVDDAHYTLEYPDYYKILPAIHDWSSDPLRTTGGRPVPPGFSYASDTNAEWMTVDALRAWIEQNRQAIGQF